MPAHKHKSAKDLGINIEAAERGEYWKILPKEFYYNFASYPLPGVHEDLMRLASIPYGRADNPGKKYLKRCQAKWKALAQSKVMQSIDEKVRHAKIRVDAIGKIRTEARKEFKEFKEGLARDAQWSRETLSKLYELAGGVFAKAMRAYLDGEEGAAIGLNAAGKVFQQVARLGTPASEDAKEEAQDLVFEKALEEMQEKLKLQEKEPEIPPVKVKGPDTDQ